MNIGDLVKIKLINEFGLLIDTIWNDDLDILFAVVLLADGHKIHAEPEDLEAI